MFFMTHIFFPQYMYISTEVNLNSKLSTNPRAFVFPPDLDKKSADTELLWPNLVPGGKGDTNEKNMKKHSPPPKKEKPR